MSTTTGKSLEELKQMRADLMAQGKELSTSKSLGKIEQAIKVANPSNYGADQVASASANLKLINEPIVSGMQGETGTGLNPTGTSDISLLEKQLSDKQSALTKATGNVNDNPWYSEATRVGKLAKLNNIAQLEIGNIQSQIAQQKKDAQDTFNNNIATQKLALDVQTANKPAKTTGTDTTKETKFTSTDKSSAYTLIKAADTANVSNPDKLLSPQEIQSVTDALMEKYGDIDFVSKLIEEVSKINGYSQWNP